MKTILSFAIIISIGFTSQSQTIETVLESNWEGGSKSITDLTQSGYFICTESMYYVNYDYLSDTFTATVLTEFDYDGVIYSCKTSVSGKYYSSSHRIYIQHEETLDSDYLPNGMYWVSANLDLTLYEDKDHDGYYLLFGQASNQSEDEEYYLLGNYPY